MADVKISGLPPSTVPLAGTEVLPIVQGGITKQVSVNNLTAGKDIAGLGLNLTSTDAGASQAPTIDLYRNSASPAASDTIGEVEFNGQDSAGNKQAYALFHGSILSPTSGSEQGQLHFETATAGALTEKMIIGTTNLVINEPGNVFNVRIEGDTDANLFYTDATNSRVGVGTISPSTKLDVNGSFNVAGAATISPANAAVAISPTGTGTVAISPAGALTINPTAASTINNTSLGATTASTGRFTSITATTGDLTISTAGKGIIASNSVAVVNTAATTTGNVTLTNNQLLASPTGGVFDIGKLFVAQTFRKDTATSIDLTFGRQSGILYFGATWVSGASATFGGVYYVLCNGSNVVATLISENNQSGFGNATITVSGTVLTITAPGGASAHISGCFVGTTVA